MNKFVKLARRGALLLLCEELSGALNSPEQRDLLVATYIHVYVRTVPTHSVTVVSIVLRLGSNGRCIYKTRLKLI